MGSFPARPNRRRRTSTRPRPPVPLADVRKNVTQLNSILESQRLAGTDDELWFWKALHEQRVELARREGEA